MDERPQQAGPSELLEVRAGLAEPSSDALGGAELESPADEAVQPDAARDDVAARLAPGKVDLVEHLGLDERQLVAAAWPAERALPGRVAVAFEAAARDCADLVDGRERRFRLRCDQDGCN